MDEAEREERHSLVNRADLPLYCRLGKGGERAEAHADTNRQDKSVGGVGEAEVRQYGGPGSQHGGSFQNIPERGAVSLCLQQRRSAFSSPRRQRESPSLKILVSHSPTESVQVDQVPHLCGLWSLPSRGLLPFHVPVT